MTFIRQFGQSMANLQQPRPVDEKYYVYRFLSKNNTIIYVGRTTNLRLRFANHEHLTSDVEKIEYIECNTMTDMIWKEIYYINLYFNEKSMNTLDVYGPVTDLKLPEVWHSYKLAEINRYEITEDYLCEIYNKYVINNSLIQYKDRIHILNNKKMNSIGESVYALSRKWFSDHEKDTYGEKLRKNLVNFYQNLIQETPRVSKNNLWTGYSDYKMLLSEKGYTRGFCKLDDEVTDKYINCHKLSFVANLFYPSKKIGTFSISEDDYALAELLKFIWRSAIRNGEEIWIYIPSIRMRNLFQKWLDSSKTGTYTCHTITNDYVEVPENVLQESRNDNQFSLFRPK